MNKKVSDLINVIKEWNLDDLMCEVDNLKIIVKGDERKRKEMLQVVEEELLKDNWDVYTCNKIKRRLIPYFTVRGLNENDTSEYSYYYYMYNKKYRIEIDTCGGNELRIWVCKYPDYNKPVMESYPLYTNLDDELDKIEKKVREYYLLDKMEEYLKNK
ncbi:hypothetical protein [Clostridium sp.]|uniref:hypothetical protein n=1 Tax=Clostridium sp. TaxID=1506 RepID=UPI00257AEF6F|nr:hypothetical protein [Clostridium sp.]MBE6058218.1 hypothetical protein [Clostridium sp.]